MYLLLAVDNVQAMQKPASDFSHSSCLRVFRIFHDSTTS